MKTFESATAKQKKQNILIYDKTNYCTKKYTNMFS